MDSITTSQLLKILKSADIDTLKGYEEGYLQDRDPTFTEYIDALIEKKQLKRQDIFQKADFPQKYGYKILSGERHTQDRDKLLRLLIAMNLNLKEAQWALTLYGMPVLYPKIKRDAIFIIAFNKGISSVETVNEWLQEYGEEELSKIGE